MSGGAAGGTALLVMDVQNDIVARHGDRRVHGVRASQRFHRRRRELAVVSPVVVLQLRHRPGLVAQVEDLDVVGESGESRPEASSLSR